MTSNHNDEMSILQELNKLKVVLSSRSFILPYIYSMIKEVEVVDYDDPMWGGAAVTFSGDGKPTLIIQRKKFKQMSPKERAFVLAHELSHIAMNHILMKFKNPSDQFIANVFADAKINHALGEAKFYIPRGVITPEVASKMTFNRISEDEILSKSVEELVAEYKRRVDNELKKLHNKLSQMLDDLAKMGGNSPQGQQQSQGQQGQQQGKNGKQTKMDNNEKSTGEKDIKKKAEEILDKVANKISDAFGIPKDQAKKITRELADNYRFSREMEKQKARAEMGNKEARDFFEKLGGMGSYVDALNKMEQRGSEGKSRGTTLAGIDKLVFEEIVGQGKINWKREFEKIFRESVRVSPVDYTYNKISKRLQVLRRKGMNVANLPSTVRRGEEPTVIVGIDTSGSISDEEYKEFVAEVVKLIKQTNAKGEIVMWEAKVTKTIPVKGRSTIDRVIKELKERKGYGGTEIHSFLEYAKEKAKKIKGKEKPTVVIFTDAYTEDVSPKDFRNFKKTIIVVSKEGSKEGLPGLPADTIYKNIKYIFMD